MNFKATYVLLAVFAALAAYLYLVDEPRQQSHQQELERQGLVLPDLDPGQVSAVTLRTPRGTVRVERREPEGWVVTAPVPDQGNTSRVGTLLGDLGSLRAERAVAGADADLEPSGLVDPELLVALEGPALSLAVGGATPAGDARYLRAGNGPVLVVKGQQVTSLLLNPDALRQPELLPDLPWGQLSAVEVRTDHGPPLRLERQGDRWWLRQPLATEADPEAVDRLTNTLRRARARGFPVTGEEAGASLAAGITVRLDWGEDVPLVTVELARVRAAVWARSSGRDAVLAVAADLWDAVQVTPEALRRRKPLQVKAWRVQELEVSRGGENRSYRKVAGAWQGGGERLAEGEAGSLQALLDALENTAAVTVIDTPTDAAVYGLEPITIKLAVALAGDSRQEIVLGQVGSQRYARAGDGTGPVYAMPKAFGETLEALLSAPETTAPGR